jgi:hypothetical protein
MKPIAKKMMLLFVGILGMLATGSSQVIINNSFENGAVLFSGLDFGNTAPTNWTVTNGIFYIIQSNGGTFNTPAQDGNYFIGLQRADASADTTNAVLSQSGLALSIGQQYSATGFVRARNTASETGLWSVNLTNAGDLGSGTALSTQWSSFSFNFTATNLTDTINLRFNNDDALGGDQMVFFDNVQIVAVPEPSVVGLLALGLCSLIWLGRKKVMSLPTRI